MLAISIERTQREPPLEQPADPVWVNESNILHSKGYQALRRWFLGLSPGGQLRANTWMRTQLKGVAKMKAITELEGGEFSYADLKMDLRVPGERALPPLPDEGSPSDSAAAEDKQAQEQEP